MRTPLFLARCFFCTLICCSSPLLRADAPEKPKSSLEPSYHELITRANKYAGEKDYITSIALYERAITLDPLRIEALFNLGAILLRQEKPDHTKALTYFDRALALEPCHAKSLHYRAKCLVALNEKENAIAAYEEALKHNETTADVYTDYARLCIDSTRYARATELLQKAYDLKPRNQTLLDLGNTYNMLNDSLRALVCYELIEKKNPTSVAVLYNIAYTLKKLGRVDEAFPYYKKVLELEPDHSEGHFGIGLSYLLMGDFEQGFREYEWRWNRGNKSSKHCPKTPEWDGIAPLEEKTLLLVAEQGLGDTFQFCRYGIEARERYHAEHVVAAVQPPLVALLSLCPYFDKVVALNAPLPRHDYHAHMLSMPCVCNTTRTTVPTHVPYLFAREDLVELWREKLSSDKNVKIGICWQGNPNYSTQFLRSVVAAKSIPLKKLIPLFAIPGISIYNLQKMTGEEQLADLPPTAHLITFGDDFDKEHGRFMDTAALIKNLDLVVTVDTGTAHIAAALGVPTWTFIPEPPDWRWMRDCTDTPWYPNMRLFRQPTIGDWDTAIADVCHELEALVREKAA